MLTKLWNVEPVRIWAAVQVLIAAVLNLGVIINWWAMSPDTLAAWNAVLAAAGGVVSAIFVRNSVSPTP